jgi:histone acetyltransferase SAS3
VTLAFLASRLAAVVSFAMAEPGRLLGQTVSDADLEDIDADGDYEMDDEYEQEAAVGTQTLQADVHTTDAEGSDVDAEGSDVDAEGEDDDEDEAEPVGAVKIALRRAASSDEEEDYHNEEEAAAHSSDAKTSDSEDESSADSEEEVPWQAESDNGEEVEVAKSDPNLCM